MWQLEKIESLSLVKALSNTPIHGAPEGLSPSRRLLSVFIHMSFILSLADEQCNTLNAGRSMRLVVVQSVRSWCCLPITLTVGMLSPHPMLIHLPSSHPLKPCRAAAPSSPSKEKIKPVDFSEGIPSFLFSFFSPLAYLKVVELISLWTNWRGILCFVKVNRTCLNWT